MKYMRSELTENLKTKLCARRRFHQIENRPDDTLENWQRCERRAPVLLWLTAIISTPPFVWMLYHLPPSRQPESNWLWVMFFIVLVPVIIACECSWMLILLRLCMPKPAVGRWIIFGNGIFHKYGKSPHRFVPFSAVRRVYVEQPDSEWSCIVLETDSEPLRISRFAPGRGDKTNTKVFLPFVNFLLERLQRHLSSDVDVQKLVELQSILRRRTMEGMERHEGFRCSDYLMMAAYFATLIPAFLLFPFAQYLVAVGYPLIWLVLIALCALFVALGRMLNRFVQRWNNRRLDRLVETMI